MVTSEATLTPASRSETFGTSTVGVSDEAMSELVIVGCKFETVESGDEGEISAMDFVTDSETAEVDDIEDSLWSVAGNKSEPSD